MQDAPLLPSEPTGIQREQADVLLVAHCFLDYRQQLLCSSQLKSDSILSHVAIIVFVCGWIPLSCVNLHNECRDFLLCLPAWRSPAVLTLLPCDNLRAALSFSVGDVALFFIKNTFVARMFVENYICFAVKLSSVAFVCFICNLRSIYEQFFFTQTNCYNFF